MKRTYVILALGAMVVFLSGMAVGQKSQVSKFAKYHTMARFTDLDWMLLEADVMDLRERAGYDEGGAAPARFFFDPKADKIVAFVAVDGTFLAKETSISVREKLLAIANSELFKLRLSIPELSTQEFEADFRSLNGGPVNFGEFKNGALVLH